MNTGQSGVIDNGTNGSSADVQERQGGAQSAPEGAQLAPAKRTMYALYSVTPLFLLWSCFA